MDLIAAQILAYETVGRLEPRWQHVSAVGRRAEALAENHLLVNQTLVVAAWLHDVGYGYGLRRTGHHAIDGALYLLAQGCPRDVLGLVAYHTGATAEAFERGLTEDLDAFQKPNSQALDILTMIDLSVGPDGSSVLDNDRISEILKRYSDEDPVHRAVTRSRPELLASSGRGKRLLGLPDDWPVVAC